MTSVKPNAVIKQYTPGAEPTFLKECTLDITQMQSLVGGYVEIIYAGPLALVCDEEGRCKGKQPSVRLGFTTLVGTVLVGKMTDEGLCCVSLEEINKAERDYGVVRI